MLHWYVYFVQTTPNFKGRSLYMSAPARSARLVPRAAWAFEANWYSTVMFSGCLCRACSNTLRQQGWRVSGWFWRFRTAENAL
jgi:hypothetical protein